MDAIKYDVKSLSYVPTDAIALDTLALQVSESKAEPLAQENKLKMQVTKEVGKEPSPKTNAMDFPPVRLAVEDLPPVKIKEDEKCPCGGNTDEDCQCKGRAFLEKAKKKAKDNWIYLAVAGVILASFILFKIIKKRK